MSQTSKPVHHDCDCPTTGLLSVDEARQRLMDAMTPIQGRERLTIRQALNRVLAEDVLSTMDVPPFSNSAMDGYALRSEDIPASGSKTLHMVGSSFAGKPYDGQVGANECIRIMTGAVMPDGADTVVMQENVAVDGQDIEINERIRAGENRRDAGEDIATGDILLSAGTRLTPADIGLLASTGVSETSVHRKLRVAFFSTGDELRPVGSQLEPGEIYDSNRYTLYGVLERMGTEWLDMGVIPDQRDAVYNALLEAAEIADVILTSGGVSVGEADFVTEALQQLGEVQFWKVAMKPGKPLATGTIGKARFFGLPGNPVSAMATYYQFVQPALHLLMGTTPPEPLIIEVPSAVKLKKSPGRLEYQRGILERDSNGQYQVRGTGKQGSHILTSMSQANCFIILPAECAGVEAGEPVQVQPFAGMI